MAEVGVFTSFSAPIIVPLSHARLSCQDELRATLPALGHCSRQHPSPNVRLPSSLSDSVHISSIKPIADRGTELLSLASVQKSAMSKKLTDEELFAQFEGIGADAEAKNGIPPASGDQKSEADLLAELELPERPKSSGRPQTPRTSTPGFVPRATPKRTGTGTPTSTDGARSSEERAQQRKSGESSRSFHNSFTPASSGEGDAEPEKSASIVPEAVQEQSSGGGWWGSVFSTASAAVKQAEALAKEIRQNEEAQRWAEQVKGNVGALRGLGMSSICRPQFI